MHERSSNLISGIKSSRFEKISLIILIFQRESPALNQISRKQFVQSARDFYPPLIDFKTGNRVENLLWNDQIAVAAKKSAIRVIRCLKVCQNLCKFCMSDSNITNTYSPTQVNLKYHPTGFYADDHNIETVRQRENIYVNIFKCVMH